MASIWNNRISVSIFGEAQGPAIGVTIDNLPPGEFIEANKLHEFMERRCPGVHSSDNFIQIMSGILKERTTGTPLCAFIQNTQTEAAPDLSRLNQLPRPGHADYTGHPRGRPFLRPSDGTALLCGRDLRADPGAPRHLHRCACTRDPRHPRQGIRLHQRR